MSLKQYSKEQILEMSLLEVAFDLLAEKKQPVSFKELMKEIKQLQNLSDEEVTTRMAQFYTDLNVDGRFTSLGENRWGLKTWYPVDQIEEEVVHSAKPKKKKAKKVVEDDFEDFEDEDLDFEDEDLDELDDEDEDADLIEVADDDDDLLDVDADDDDFEDDDLDEDLIDEESDDEELDEDDELEDEEEIEDEKR
ncbi:DNA-directed RNA polymerase subunit delta [Peribacillus glennii]|uniref:Probable DNA-directed RNA polymerase subunit delta n=1 Tax=Peribacillus glennii TaxID=2303991 RepID=A0A372L9R2_9BACI|nr:DNA-directed RNA polymerase subunit delta [Peribacillus glennii]RFU62352.1 DNA-directed RNA polymerase subunit delta [Peribacillus glennii]